MEAGESCDDGNRVTETCEYGQGPCTVCNAACAWQAGDIQGCGDNRITHGETCDDGNAVTEACFYGQRDCMVCNSMCQRVPGEVAFCGDGTVTDGEQCDEGLAPDTSCAYGLMTCMVCNNQCVRVAGAPSFCGDGTRNGPEACDDGNTVTEACTYGMTSCTVCGSSCTQVAGATSFCSDGTVNGPETCDDGNAVAEACTYGMTSCMVCNNQCRQAPGAVSYCGDGAVNGPEACDDGNTTTEECAYGLRSCTVCNNQCRSVAGAVRFCGDGRVNGAETCDDANTNNDDGCRNNCTEDPDYVCTGSPSVCSTSLVDFVNLTSFPIISVVVDGVELGTCGTGYGTPVGAYTGQGGVLTLSMKPNRPHTIRLQNGAYGTNPCSRMVYEEWTLNQPALPPNGDASYNLVNGRSLPQAVMRNSGQTYQCFFLSYRDSWDVTRVARYRFNADGTFVFRETRNVGDVLLRSFSGRYVETSRTLNNLITFELHRNDSSTRYAAQYDAAGAMFIRNTESSTGVLFPTLAGHGRDPSMCP